MLFSISEEQRRQEELARQREAEELERARQERERQKEEERVRFQKVMDVLNQEMQIKMEALGSWKTENMKQMQVSRDHSVYRSLQNPCNTDCINFHIWKLVCTCSSIVVVRTG